MIREDLDGNLLGEILTREGQPCNAARADERAHASMMTAVREGQAVRIEVADNGNGEGAGISASQSTGVGLANIRDRLTQAYGASHRFETRKNERGGFSVIVEIPFETGDKG